MLVRGLRRTFVVLAVCYVGVTAAAQTHISVDLDLGRYGFKGIPSRELLRGLVTKPDCLFLDENHVALLARVREKPKLSARPLLSSLRTHYSGVVIDLKTAKVVSTFDLGGADDNSASESLSNGELVFYDHGVISFWKLGADEVLRKKGTLNLDVHEIEKAWTRREQADLVHISPSFTHRTLYLYLDAPLSGLRGVWKITPDRAEQLRPDLSIPYLEATIESDDFLLSANWQVPDCRLYVISNRTGVSPQEIYHQDACQDITMPSVISRDEIAITSGAKGAVPQFRTDTGEATTHPGVSSTAPMMAAWDGSAVMGTRYRSSGGFEALDISSHISGVTATIFDKDWHKRCAITMKIRGADYSGPVISPRSGWVAMYDYGHFYAWNIRHGANGKIPES